MKKLILLLVVILSASNLRAQFPQWNWATSIGGRANGDAPAQICQDNQHNIIACGDFTGTHTFGSASLTAIGVSDAFIAKFDENGIYQWAVQLGGSSTLVQASSVTTDPAGNVYVVGSFTYAINFGPSTIYSAGSKDVFIVKYNSSGVFIWGHQYGGQFNDDATAVAWYNNNLYVSGSYIQAFTDGTVSYPQPAGNVEDLYVSRFDASGNCLQTVTAGGSQSDHAYGLSISANALYVTGSYSGTANFSGTNITAAGTATDFFLAKYDPSLTLNWVIHAGNIGTDIGNSVSQDFAGNAYVAGYFLRSVNFGNNIIMTEQNGYGDGFVVKYNSAGVCQWANKISSAQSDQAAGIYTDSGGSSVVTGYFASTALISGSNSSSMSLTSTGGTDIFISKYGTNGTLRWAAKAGGTSDDRGKNTLAGANGDFFVTGNFTGTATFGSAGAVSAPAGVNGCLVARLYGGTVGLTAPIAEDAFNVYPNPAKNQITLQLNGDDKILAADIYTPDGKLVLALNYVSALNKSIIDISKLVPGIYLLSIRSANGYASRQLTVN